jgi:hypothetical protein
MGRAAVTSRSQAKGDAFERLIAGYLRDELGPHITRPRAGEPHDRGDFGGIPGWTIQAKCYADMLRAIRDGLHDLEAEQATTATPYGCAIVKRLGVTAPGQQLAVMTLERLVPIMREVWE